MYKRLINIPESQSFFLFGARGTGKSTLLKANFSEQVLLWIDLLDVNIEAEYSRNPMLLAEQVRALSSSKKWVVIDEVQKIPKLLDVVHLLIENSDLNFALSGSSARKLKRGGANLLAGRAFERHLFPLSPKELKEDFDLENYLMWGGLPKIYELNSESDKADYLQTYINTYLREEVQAEQMVRKMPPFRNFIEVAAQSSGRLINYSKIAKDVNSDAVSIKNYFQILEDTLLGFYLPPYHRSVRKRQGKTAKFYFFDPGVIRALERKLDLPLNTRTSDYGHYFEHFIIQEIFRINSYNRSAWRLSFLNTKDDVEIDLIMDKPGKPTFLIEIKSCDHVEKRQLRHLQQIGADVEGSEKVCLSREPKPKIIDGVKCFHWQEGINYLFA